MTFHESVELRRVIGAIVISAIGCKIRPHRVAANAKVGAISGMNHDVSVKFFPCPSVVTLLQLFYESFTVFFQHLYSAFTTLLQHFYNTFTPRLRHFYDTCTTHLQHFYKKITRRRRKRLMWRFVQISWSWTASRARTTSILTHSTY